MGFFNIFGEQEHRVFNYKPIYYDKEKEERKRMFGAVDGSLEKEKEKAKEDANKAQNIIGLVGLLLIFVVLFYIAKFYSLL